MNCHPTVKEGGKVSVVDKGDGVHGGALKVARMSRVEMRKSFSLEVQGRDE